LGRVRGFDAWQIGTALLSAGIFQLMAVPFYGMLANRIDLRWLMMFGLACFGVARWLFTPATQTGARGARARIMTHRASPNKVSPHARSD
jgi:MFS transporter, DHA2 family, multidrug resistance protein